MTPDRNMKVNFWIDFLLTEDINCSRNKIQCSTVQKNKIVSHFLFICFADPVLVRDMYGYVNCKYD